LNVGISGAIHSAWSCTQLSGEIRLKSETPSVYWNLVVFSVTSSRSALRCFPTRRSNTP
jgi:hypothetical protein